MIVDEIKVSSLTMVPSLGEIDALYGRVFLSGSGGMVWILTKEIPPHQYLLQILLADHSHVGSRYVASYAVTCDSRNSTGHRLLADDGAQMP